MLDLKLVLLGHKNVGKTSLFNRYSYDDFGRTSMTIGAYFGIKVVNVDGNDFKLAIWDTAGEEKFDALTNFYCRNANAAIICYDITNYDSFAGLQRWVDKIVQETENCSIILVGNKLDLVQKHPEYRKVDFAEAKRYATTLNAEVVEASAKSGHNVGEVFIKMVRACNEHAKAMGMKMMNGRGGRGGNGRMGGNRRSINFNDNVHRRNTRQLDQNSGGGGCCK